MTMKPVLPGKYRHFKGNAYEALGIALHTETLEELVVYRALDGAEKLWARPAAMWNETVEKDGAPVRRFEPIERRVRLSLGEPVVIAQAPPLPSGQDHWGLFQFPTVERLPDGRLHCEYHIGKDSALAYGKPKGHAVSGDGGRSWQDCDFPGGGILLKNGSSLRCKIAEALTPEEAGLPSFPDAAVVCYGQTRAIYRGERLDARFRQFPFELTEPDGTVRTVLREVAIPDIAFFAGEGVVPRPMFTRLRRAPDGRLWAIGYPYCILPNRPAACQAVFCVSDDEGESFSYLSRIEYQPDPLADPYYRVRGGFTEPDVCFLPDGTVLCLMRTTDGNGIGPLYCSVSLDQGKTWSRPVVFDHLGVWPSLCTLENGVTLVSYGRPGLFLRASADPSGHNWDDRIPLIEPGYYQTETCSYSELLPLSRDEAYIVYSDFAYPNADGVPCKTILGRTVTALR